MGKKWAVLIVVSFAVVFLHAQPYTFKGVVRDLYLHQPIPGALITMNGKAIIRTDSIGEFQLILFGEKDSYLTVDALGYTSRNILPDKGMRSMEILLEAVNYQTSHIQVRGLYNGTTLLQSPGSIGNLVKKDIQRTSLVNFANTFNLIPGARLEFRNSSIGARIILRGYGNQNNNNGIGYKAYYNDIPLTDADGTTILDDIDFTTLGRVEVFKGPVSSVYGTGIGGVVNMMSAEVPGNSISQTAIIGADGMLRTTTTVGLGNEKNNVVLTYGVQKTDGWRINDDSRKNFWNINVNIHANEKSRFSLFAGMVQSEDQIPGQVDSFGLANYPDTAELTNIRNNSRSELRSLRVGLTHEYFFSKNFSNKTTVFFGSQDINQWVSTILTKTDKNMVGGRTAFNLDVPIGNVASRFTVGTEVVRNITFQESYNLGNGIQGSMRTDQKLKPMQWNVFAKVELTLAKRTLMIFSGAANFIEYSNDDLYKPASSAYVYQTGYRKFTPLVTPRWVINHLVAKNVSVYANYSMGFGQPGTNQFIIPQTGKVNNELKPEISNTFEVGGKASLFNESLYVDLAYYNMDVTDKIITQTFPAVTGATPVPAYTAFVNAGTVNMVGAELTMNYVFKPKTKGFLQLVRPFLTYQNNNSRNIDLKSNNNNNTTTKDYSNYRISGLARNILNTGIDIEAANGFYLYVTDMYSDKMPINLDNTTYADSYNLVNVKTGYRREFGGKNADRYEFDVFWGMNNIYNARYAQFVVINLVPAGTTAPKFFSPGPPAQGYGGIILRYKFK